MFRYLLILTIILLQSSSFVQAKEIYVDGYIVQHDVQQTNAMDRKVVDSYNAYYDLFIDNSNGYQLLVPKNSTIDITNTSFCNSFTTPNLKVEVYYDNLTNNTASFSSLINYSNRFLQKGQLHSITATYYTSVGGYTTHITKWQRGKLSKITNDKNYYLAASIAKNSQEIYTILLKSTTPIEDSSIVGSFKFVNKAGTVRDFIPFEQSTTPKNELTKQVFDKLFSTDAGLTWGIFEYSAPQNFTKLQDIEEKLNHKFKVLLRYQTIDEKLPLTQLQKAWDNDRIVQLTLATIHNVQANALWSDGVHPNSKVAYDILNGKYDEYFVEYAKDLKTFGKPILFRLNNEMNSDWCWYGAFYTARDSDIYKQLWHYIRKIFDQQGVDNLIWVWNPHDVSLPDFAWNNSMTYYPGNKYVDVIGLTGYNNGTYFAGEKWRSFNEIYKPLYNKNMNLFDKPFMVTEFSSNNVGGNKAQWINDMFKNLPAYKNIKVAVWWNGVDYDQNGNPGRVYLIDDSQEVVSAMKNGLSLYQSKVKEKQ